MFISIKTCTKCTVLSLWSTTRPMRPMQPHTSLCLRNSIAKPFTQLTQSRISSSSFPTLHRNIPTNIIHHHHHHHEHSPSSSNSSLSSSPLGPFFKFPFLQSPPLLHTFEYISEVQNSQSPISPHLTSPHLTSVKENKGKDRDHGKNYCWKN